MRKKKHHVAEKKEPGMNLPGSFSNKPFSPVGTKGLDSRMQITSQKS
jgi:hypothetical protein